MPPNKPKPLWGPQGAEPEQPVRNETMPEERIAPVRAPPAPAKQPAPIHKNPYIQSKEYEAAVARAREKEIAQYATNPLDTIEEKPGRFARLLKPGRTTRRAGRVPLPSLLVAASGIVSAVALAVVVCGILSVTSSQVTSSTGGALLGWVNSFGVAVSLAAVLLVSVGTLLRRKNEPDQP